MSDKLPALHFYVQDYLADTRSLSNELKGFYVDLLCYMHKSSRRGYLQQPSGNPYSLQQLAVMTGCSTDEASRLYAELIACQVISATPKGIAYSRRMVRDEQKRLIGQKFGRMRGKKDPEGHPEGVPIGFSEDEDEKDLKRKGGGAGGGKTKSDPAFLHPLFFGPEFFEAWHGWAEMRKKIRKPLTPRAVKLALRTLEALCHGKENKCAHAIKILDKAVESSWQGLYQVEDEANGTNRKNHGGNESAQERRDRKFKEAVASLGGTPESDSQGDSPDVRLLSQGNA
jgi:hypothetical protein